MEKRKVRINYKRYPDIPIGSEGVVLGRSVEIAMWMIKIDGVEKPMAFHIFEFDDI